MSRNLNSFRGLYKRLYTGLPYKEGYWSLDYASYGLMDFAGLRKWNYDGSSTEQADGQNSEVYLYPKAIFKARQRYFQSSEHRADLFGADDMPTMKYSS